MRKVKIATLNVGSMTGRSGDIAQLMRMKSLQTGCPQDEKETFWEHMDSEVQAVTRSERVVVAGDLNGHVAIDRAGDWMWLMRMA